MPVLIEREARVTDQLARNLNQRRRLRTILAFSVQEACSINLCAHLHVSEVFNFACLTAAPVRSGAAAPTGSCRCCSSD